MRGFLSEWEEFEDEGLGRFIPEHPRKGYGFKKTTKKIRTPGIKPFIRPKATVKLQKWPHRKKGIVTRRGQLAILADIIVAHLKRNPCIDCGEDNIIVLDFDHREPKDKVGSIAEMKSRCAPKEVLITEIAKCDIRCANCHRIKTYREKGYKTRGPALP